MATSRVCSIPDCGKPARSLGWCNSHYQRWLLYKSPLGGSGYRERHAPMCSIEGCGMPTRAKALCNRHYGKLRRFGDPTAGYALKTPRGAAKEFLQKALNYDGDECLIWPFQRSRSGYAFFTAKGKTSPVHQLVCAHVNGARPSPKHEVAHSCGNGVNGCVAATHLRWATKSENEADKLQHGSRLRGEQLKHSKLTADDVRTIRQLAGELPYSHIAKRFGVDPSSVRDIVTRRNWAWLP